ncbi:MAG: NAD(P)-binding domain-containing protein [Oligoflexia bacterium]|nr:NAD(P)-binding domain-containing protein [Oligoflexia bacterium]
MKAAVAFEKDQDTEFRREILSPAECRALVDSLREQVYVYRYTHLVHGWVLAIGTHIGTIAPAMGRPLSLGGFRIVPEARAQLPGFLPEREAIELSVGMEEKVFWSKIAQVGGPRGLKNLQRIVGGKCVLLAPGGRVGEALDLEALQFAVSCMHDFEAHSGISIVTGQDLGHGQLSQGGQTSLEFLRDNFHGSVIADTGKPTAEGNFYMLKGTLNAFDIPISSARIGIIGAGNIGEHLIKRLVQHGGSVVVLESLPAKQQKLTAQGLKVYGQEQKQEFLGLSVDALAVNANGGTLDDEAVNQICSNPEIKIICGCENLAMPNSANEAKLLAARKVYCHTELCGMMGYLTAVEEYLARTAGQLVKIEEMYEAAAQLENIGFKGARGVLESGYTRSLMELLRG